MPTLRAGDGGALGLSRCKRTKAFGSMRDNGDSIRNGECS